MTPEQFIDEYAKALSMQCWEAVEHLIHSDAAVTFSDGSVHKGKQEVKNAFERNFSSIKDETYSISDVHWVSRSPIMAVFLFKFDWEGYVNGAAISGGGRGTSVLVNGGGGWQLLAEHLSKGQ